MNELNEIFHQIISKLEDVQELLEAAAESEFVNSATIEDIQYELGEVKTAIEDNIEE